MKVKISDRESESKMKRWMDGEKGVFSKEPVNCEINNISQLLEDKREFFYKIIENNFEEQCKVDLGSWFSIGICR